MTDIADAGVRQRIADCWNASADMPTVLKIWVPSTNDYAVESPRRILAEFGVHPGGFQRLPMDSNPYRWKSAHTGGFRRIPVDFDAYRWILSHTGPNSRRGILKLLFNAEKKCAAKLRDRTQSMVYTFFQLLQKVTTYI